jgi:uncharacterized protein
MMLVVADTSPLVVLANIQQTGVLSALFGQVVVPPEVMAELRRPYCSKAARDLAGITPQWLIEKSPVRVEFIPKLDLGESAAISLALELKADALLIDETAGRKAASQRGFHVTGALGVLIQAADANLLDLAQAFAQVKQTDFWISHAFLDETLRSYRQRKDATK